MSLIKNPQANCPNFTQTSESTDSLREYLYLFWSWAWLIILAGLLGGAAAYFVSINTTPVYQTYTRLLVSEPAVRTGDYTAIISSSTMARTYAEMIVERVVLQGVIDQLALPRTPEQLKGATTVSLVSNTQLLQISVQDSSPVLAADIANAIARVFTERITTMQAGRYAATRQGLDVQIADMEAKIESTNQAILSSPNPEQQAQLEGRLTEYLRLHSDLVASLQQIQMAEAQNSTTVTVSEPATVPARPISPKTTNNTLLGAAVGAMLAAGLVFLLEYLDDTLKNPDEIRQRFDLPILGLIGSHDASGSKPIAMLQPRSPVAEGFRALRTNLTFASVDKPLRRLLVTSATPREGKTTITANLAVVLAQADRSVALVDGDLRRPQIDLKFGLSNHTGLSDLFLMMRPLDKLPGGVIHCLDKLRLGIITSGKLPPNPSELLTSQKMGQFLDLLNQEYEIVVIDTPPLLSVTDAAAMASSVDGVLLVARPGVTRLRDFQQALQQLETVGARVLGVVLNRVDPRSHRYGYYYHRYYSKYSHYYDAEGTRLPKP